MCFAVVQRRWQHRLTQELPACKLPRTFVVCRRARERRQAWRALQRRPRPHAARERRARAQPGRSARRCPSTRAAPRVAARAGRPASTSWTWTMTGTPTSRPAARCVGAQRRTCGWQRVRLATQRERADWLRAHARPHGRRSVRPAHPCTPPPRAGHHRLCDARRRPPAAPRRVHCDRRWCGGRGAGCPQAGGRGHATRGCFRRARTRAHVATHAPADALAKTMPCPEPSSPPGTCNVRNNLTHEVDTDCLGWYNL